MTSADDTNKAENMVERQKVREMAERAREREREVLNVARRESVR